MPRSVKITVREELDQMTLPALQMRMGDVSLFTQRLPDGGTEIEIERLGGITHEEAEQLLRQAGMNPIGS